ncbi:cation-translocating P-type ATPase [Sphingomonas sp. ID1715]|uniref:cation-translocating P-type ATPase n=1 Tax=Sphingomonas sp. ID1715 TaxID=1656898 RepID=UPI0014885343|nr:cation-translocating P-type ATPase [Sphingomonas sp. ID1715]NNM76456.1 cation-translocating P-type ATPase [Sphingomonas sp. ID1715]
MEAIAEQLRTGLSPQEAASRLARDGPNALPPPPKRSVLATLAGVLREPMLALLLAGGLIYLLLGDAVEALVLLGFACFSIALTAAQERRTERALEALRELSAPTANVVRNGQVVTVPASHVVRGDLLVLNQGDRVAADGRLLEADQLEADESLLTGESVPVPKTVGTASEASGSEILSGTIVTRGTGLAQVTATGPATTMGQIGASLAIVEAEVPRLRLETARMVRLCGLGAVCVAASVVVLYGIDRGGWLEALLAGIAIAMSLLPEEFPVVLTIFLAVGAWRLAKIGVLTRRASAIEALGSATILCSDKTGTLTENRMSVVELWSPLAGHFSFNQSSSVSSPFDDLLRTAMLASAPAPVDPMEIAFHQAAGRKAPSRTSGALVQQFGLRTDLLAMANAWATSGAHMVLITAKGAPEAIGSLCRLSEAEGRSLTQAAQAMAAKGMRVLAVAKTEVTPDAVGATLERHHFQLLGLAGLLDPLRPGVGEAISQCRAAGMRVVMITGDHPVTARALATQAGIGEGELISGADVARFSEAELTRRIGGTTVFARIMPDQKLRIVRALQGAGEVVAMTGDGVNDAPALKAADIGIAMGKRGTDVAREAASIVLIDDDFTSIIDAVRLGRRIYDNLQKAMGFIFAVHVPIAGLAILPLVTGLPILLGPIQIALLEMIIDPMCALMFEAEEEEPDLMARPPRPASEWLMSIPLVAVSVSRGLLAFAAAGAVFLTASRWGVAAAELRTMTFFSVVSTVIVLALISRKKGGMLFSSAGHTNRALVMIVAGIGLLTAAVFAFGPVREGLQFAAIGAVSLAYSLGPSVLLLLLLQLTKTRSCR